MSQFTEPGEPTDPVSPVTLILAQLDRLPGSRAQEAGSPGSLPVSRAQEAGSVLRPLSR